MSKKKNYSKKNKPILYLLMFGIFLLGFFVGLILSHSLFPEKVHPSLLLRESGYEYINPLIDFDNIDFIKTKEAKDLEKQLNNLVRREIQDNHNISHISIYYRDLNTGVWIGINEKEKFALASLTKVPLMIAHFKIAETNPEHLKTKYVYNFDREKYLWILDDNRIPEYSLTEGESYTIDEYIKQLIVYSDNTALIFLTENETMQGEQVDKIYSDLGLTNPYYGEDENRITAREYSSLFRILYNATYLNKEMSSKALELLSQVTYDNGLAKGIPENIVLANKFGERIYEEENGDIEQLHDCGIIYHPTKPYVLCVMTRGNSQPVLADTISHISSIVYNVVDSSK